jgi:glycosyltransferase involved in cell wall biosynthesis
MGKPTLVSIVVPTYNEEADIGATLDSLVALDYPAKEIIVVDASHDKTPDIVRSYADRGALYIRQTRGIGRAPARNEGILRARGEVVVILNADVRLPTNFLHRIVSHYDAGADFVLVESLIVNLDKPFARYVQAEHDFLFGPGGPITDYNWTEGFSCRREAAIAAGGFPETIPPMASGEDEAFGLRLRSKGYRRTLDSTIVVTHVNPWTLKDYFNQRHERGYGGPQRLILEDRREMSGVRNAFVRSTIWTSLQIVTLLPPAWYALKLARASEMGLRDLPIFVVARIIELVANRVGNWHGYLDIRRAQREGKLKYSNRTLEPESAG